MKIRKIILFNFLFLFLGFLLLYILLSVLNFIVSAPPRYNEFVYKFDKNNPREKKEKLIFYKSKNLQIT